MTRNPWTHKNSWCNMIPTALGDINKRYMYSSVYRVGLWFAMCYRLYGFLFMLALCISRLKPKLATVVLRARHRSCWFQRGRVLCFQKVLAHAIVHSFKLHVRLPANVYIGKDETIIGNTWDGKTKEHQKTRRWLETHLELLLQYHIVTLWGQSFRNHATCWRQPSVGQSASNLAVWLRVRNSW